MRVSMADHLGPSMVVCITEVFLIQRVITERFHCIASLTHKISCLQLCPALQRSGLVSNTDPRGNHQYVHCTDTCDWEINI